MRAGPLSRTNVIETLNRYFVPVYTSNEDYQDNGSAPPEERKEYDRIYREALDKKLSTGTVHAYVLTPDGHPFDSLHVAQAAKVEELTALLDRAVAKLKTPEGAPLVRPAPQFQLYDQQSQIVRLARYLGRDKLLIAFYDGSQGPEESVLLGQLRERFPELHRARAAVLAISASRPSENRYGVNLEHRPAVDPRIRVALIGRGADF